MPASSSCLKLIIYNAHGASLSSCAIYICSALVMRICWDTFVCNFYRNMVIRYWRTAHSPGRSQYC